MNKFRPTKQQLRRAWCYYNATVFAGSLQQLPKFTFNKSRSHYAWTITYRRVTEKISFSVVNCETVEDYIATLLHEMVHQWQAENLGNNYTSDNDGHGKCFQVWESTVCKHYDISEDFEND